MTPVTAQTQPTWYRGFIQGKTRITLAWLFTVLIGFSARHYPSWPGIVLCFMGGSLRFWASGYLRKDSRPAVGGPYAFVRNPLYLGTYMMALGTIWSIDQVPLLIIATLVFAAIYHYIILDEEVKLHRIFKEPYSVYCENVPRFFPRVWPPMMPATSKILDRINPEISQRKFSWDLAMKNKAYEAYLSFAGLIGFVTAIAYIWQRI